MSDPHTADYLRAAERWFSAARRLATTQDPNRKLDAVATLGDRLADKVAGFGGSWAFIIGFLVFLACWAAFNTVIDKLHAPDPYPFIFLNLILSMLAALQAPVIMMSQNRQADKDRLMATHDYEVNLKAEIEIMALHEKIDAVRTQQLEALLARQQEQLELLTRLVTKLEDQAKP